MRAAISRERSTLRLYPGRSEAPRRVWPVSRMGQVLSMVEVQARVHAELDRLAPVLQTLGERFAAAGEELALVGGPVRDIMLGRAQSDLDFTTSALQVVARAVACDRQQPRSELIGILQRRDRTQRADEDVLHEVVHVAPRRMGDEDGVDDAHVALVDARERGAVAALRAQDELARRVRRDAGATRADERALLLASSGCGVGAHADLRAGRADRERR